MHIPLFLHGEVWQTDNKFSQYFPVNPWTHSHLTSLLSAKIHLPLFKQGFLLQPSPKNKLIIWVKKNLFRKFYLLISHLTPLNSGKQTQK